VLLPPATVIGRAVNARLTPMPAALRLAPARRSHLRFKDKLFGIGARWWIRTTDPRRVKAMLYH
jgi:hypothetical protein